MAPRTCGQPGVFRFGRSISTTVWGPAFFSANDRLAAGQRLDLAVLNASQLRFVRQSTPTELAGAIIAPADDPRGFAVVRVFVPDETWTGISARFADALECRSLEF